MKKIKNIYLSTAEPGSGKTEIGLGLGMVLKEKGYKVAYFKPFGIPKGKSHVDPEVDIIAEIFELDKDIMCPSFIERLYFETLVKDKGGSLKKKIVDAYNKLNESHDVVIIEGIGKANQLISFDLDDTKLSQELENCKILAVNSLDYDIDVDDAIAHKNLIDQRGGTMIGCIFNKVPKIMAERLQQDLSDFFKEKGINVLGIVPREEKLAAPTIGEIKDSLNGKLLDEDEGDYDFEALVERVLVGAMSAQSALSYFRKSMNTVVITGGDRADIVLSALQTNVTGIILTGNLFPDLTVISAAKEKNVPLILVPYDTYTTTSMVENTVADIQLHEAEICKELVEKHVDVDALLDAFTQ
ncbi:MAG: phosphotransacetylase family protein [Candidatus Hodarchaeota archaeon]